MQQKSPDKRLIRVPFSTDLGTNLSFSAFSHGCLETIRTIVCKSPYLEAVPKT